MAFVVRCSGLEGGAWRDDALGRVAPERHQELAGKRHDRDPADPPMPLPDACAEPDTQGGVRLMAEPEPSTAAPSIRARRDQGRRRGPGGASSIIAWRRRWLPDFEMPCSRSVPPLCHGLGANPA